MRRTSHSFYICLLAILLSLASSCARKPDDAKVSSDIQNKFSQDSGLSGKQLTVQASNGVVTLGGTVDNDAQRDAASRQAASVSGVEEVVNNLQVGIAPQTAAAAVPEATQISDPPAPASVRTDREASGGSRRRKDRV